MCPVSAIPACFCPHCKTGEMWGDGITPRVGSLTSSPLVFATIRGAISDGENKLPSALHSPHTPRESWNDISAQEARKGTKPSKRNTNNLHVKYRRQPWHWGLMSEGLPLTSAAFLCKLSWKWIYNAHHMQFMWHSSWIFILKDKSLCLVSFVNKKEKEKG